MVGRSDRDGLVRSPDIAHHVRADGLPAHLVFYDHWMGVRTGERDDREAIVSALVALIGERYLDRHYVTSPAWVQTRTDLAAAVDGPAFEDRVASLVGGLPLSHTHILPPDLVARISAASAEPTPPHLRRVFRAGPRWTYLKLPSLTLPAFSSRARGPGGAHSREAGHHRRAPQ